jgi:hypothetical protein
LRGFRGNRADRDVPNHAPTQRAHGLVGHGGAPVVSEGCEPIISRQDARSRYRESVSPQRVLPRERFSPLALLGPPEMPELSPQSGRYCCKSPKLPGANFPAVKKSDRRPPIDVPQSRYRGRKRVFLRTMRSPTCLHGSRLYSQKKF